MHPKYLFGIVAVGIYVAVIGLVFYYFGYHHTQKAIRFTAKKGEAITVNLQSATSPQQARKTKVKPKQKSLSRARQRTKPKPIATTKPPRAKATRPVRKPSAKKAVKPKSLFAHVKPDKTVKKSLKKTSNALPKRAKASRKGASKSNHRTIKQQTNHQKGIENRYLAGVQDRLYGWPPQPGFVGAKITIRLEIHPNGRFTYKVLALSGNPEFNRTVERYLNQLQSEGFGPTPEAKSYVFKVDILAK